MYKGVMNEMLIAKVHRKRTFALEFLCNNLKISDLYCYVNRCQTIVLIVRNTLRYVMPLKVIRVDCQNASLF